MRRKYTIYSFWTDYADLFQLIIGSEVSQYRTCQWFSIVYSIAFVLLYYFIVIITCKLLLTADINIDYFSSAL